MAKLVADAMTRDLLTVTPETPLAEAVQLLAKHRVSGLLVLNQQQELVGILSESDLLWQATGAPLPAYVMLLDSVVYLTNPAQYQAELHKALGQTVGEVMSPGKVPTVEPEASLQDAARLMHAKKLTRLPVVTAAGELVGILTQGDIVQAIAERYQAPAANVSG